MSEYTDNILHLYPDLLNLYGDKGNIECMRKRLTWRGIGANVTSCTNKNDIIDFDNTDIIFVGGGSDREQEIVCTKLLKYKKELSDFVERGGSLVAVCGGYQLLGSYYQTGDKKIEGLGILDIYGALLWLGICPHACETCHRSWCTRRLCVSSGRHICRYLA